MTSSTARSVKKTIERSGAPALIEKKGEPFLNPVTRVNEMTTTSYKIHLAIDSTSLVSLGEIFGPGLVNSGDLLVSMHNLYPFEPKDGDGILLNGDKYDIITKKPVFYKKGEVVMWKVLIRYGQRNDSRARGM